MTKNSRKLLPTAIAVLLLMTVMCAAVSANALQVSKTITSTGPYTYNVQTGVGSTIQYTMTVERPSLETHGFLVYVVTDTSPHPGGTVTTLDSNFYLNPGDTRTYYASHTLTLADFVGTPPYSLKNRCEADGIENATHQAAFGGADTICDIEKIDRPPVYTEGDEFWTLEWFQTNPHQYTQFNITSSPGEKYLTTLSWIAPESCIHLWNGGGEDEYEPILNYTGERVKFWHDPTNDTSDIYTNHTGPNCSIRVYGTFGEGPGDHTVEDRISGLKPENPPYTDPIAPCYPQANQSPMKDFVTFNPAIMEHNEGYPQLIFYDPQGSSMQYPGEKVFKRMWYEKELFKDHNSNGCFDVVFEDKVGGKHVICLEDEDAIHNAMKKVETDDWKLLVHNNDPTVNSGDVDIYGPSINQEFTYMFLDNLMPVMIKDGSRVLIPMAHNDSSPYRGLNSFDADDNSSIDGDRDVLLVKSEDTLDLDIDHDGDKDRMDMDGVEVSSDESVVLVLSNKFLREGDEIQFFDHKVKLLEGFTNEDRARFLVRDNEGGNRQTTVTILEDGIVYFDRAYESTNPGTSFYLKVISADEFKAEIEVGRLFGRVDANIGGTNVFWSQKAFMVNNTFYNVVAIKAKDNTIKYITFRQKLPKEEIKLYGVHLYPYAANELLAEMSPFNMDHKMCLDVQSTWTLPPMSQMDKIGEIKPSHALEVRYTDEDEEERFKGELKEIYWENATDEFWTLEWFQTNPHQYTEFNITRKSSDAMYLLTSGFYAPQSCIHLWNGGGEDEYEPMLNYTGERVKFWFNESCDGLEPLYIDDGELKIYGTFGEGPGDHTIEDRISGLKPENPPYTNPIAPFYPQADQSPRKDFVTFNPAIMEHNEGYDQLIFYDPQGGSSMQYPGEKVFKRMWYEKELFKDHNSNGCFDVVFEDKVGGKHVICLEDEDAIHNAMKKVETDDWKLLVHNNDPTVNSGDVDIYGPSINQEFTYMFLDNLMPVMIKNGSRVLIPMAHNDSSPYRGLNSFDADDNSSIDGDRDVLLVKSENTLGLDIDHDGDKDRMDMDGVEVSSDESVVLVLSNKFLREGDEIQFFDHKVKLLEGFTNEDRARFLVRDNEGGNRQTTVTILEDGIVYFDRAYESTNPGTSFYLKVISADEFKAEIEVGRLFGRVDANIGGTNVFWSQKAFMVNNTFYNVVAIKAKDNTIKYITFRQKLPKEEIKLYGVHLHPYATNELLAEMSPFNMVHDICEDVQSTWTLPPMSQLDKVGPRIRGVDPLDVKYTVEAEEPRFHGELKEIYWENETWTSPEEPKRLEGDVTDTGLPITGADAQLVAQHIVGTTTLTGEDAQAADVNDDSGGVTPNVTGADLQLIKQYVVGTITVFPGGQYIP